MKKIFDYVILLDDIVLDQGEVEAMNGLEAEEALEWLYPNSRYVITEKRK
jgi:hypothetical protein